MCESCNAVYAQCGDLKGVVHERGCPDEWKETTAECKWCGTEFEKEESDQVLCGEDCAMAYYGI